MLRKCQSIFLCCILIHVQKGLSSPLTEPYGNITSKTNSDLPVSVSDNVHESVKSVIQTEAGSIPISNNSDIGRENTLKKPNLNSQVSTSASVNATSKNSNIQNATAVLNHHGRENVLPKLDTSNHTESSTVSTKVSSNHSTLVSKDKSIPVSEGSVMSSTAIMENGNKEIISSTTVKTVKKTEEVIEVVGDSKIKPRKGAPPLELLNSTTVKPTTQKPKKMKPTVTVGSDDESFSFVSKEHWNKHNINSSVPKNKQAVDEIISVHHYKKGPDYVLPIVMVILAVPLVAVIIAVLYKRGSEWWHHRHYRRMDFLIDGIYNN